MPEFSEQPRHRGRPEWQPCDAATARADLCAGAGVGNGRQPW